jgi:hypothetical protein
MLSAQHAARGPGADLDHGVGQTGSIYDLRGKVVLVNFWATWCVPLPARAADAVRHAGAIRGSRARGCLSITRRSGSRRPFLRAHPLTGTTARLEHAADYYQAGKFFPITYLLARDGSVEKRWSGRPTQRWLADSIEAQL